MVLVSCLGHQDQSEGPSIQEWTLEEPLLDCRKADQLNNFNSVEKLFQINSNQMLYTTMAGLTKENQGIKLYFIRCSRHSPTKMMFYITILMASSSMTSVEEEADDREISRRPKLSYRGEREDSFNM